MCNECEACPFNIFSELSVEANNYGCLPDYKSIIEDFKEQNTVWACHDNPKKACNGFLNYFKQNRTEVEYKDILKLIENNKLMYDWSIHGKKYDFTGFLKSYIKKGSLVDIKGEGSVVVIDFKNFDNMYFLNNDGKVIVDKISNITFFYFSNNKKFIQLKELRIEALSL